MLVLDQLATAMVNRSNFAWTGFLIMNKTSLNPCPAPMLELHTDYKEQHPI